jgi:iron complex transport system ATP-binding protein
MIKTLLIFDDVCLTLSGKRILSAISFTVQPGEYLSVVGENGAGKTTLLRCAIGFLPPQKGQIRVFGQSLSGYSRRELARIAAYVPQDLEAPFPISVQEFVQMGRFPHLSFMQPLGKKDELVVNQTLLTCGLSGLEDRLISSLSGGERQRVLIAAALCQEPKLLLLDEVCHFLDPSHASEVQLLLSRLNREQGVTIVSITHDINEAALHSSRVLALREGSIIFDGRPATFMSKSILYGIYGRNFTFVQHPTRDIPMVVPEG